MTNLEHTARGIFKYRGNKWYQWHFPGFRKERHKCMEAAKILINFFDKLEANPIFSSDIELEVTG
jgi:hypothetical protein